MWKPGAPLVRSNEWEDYRLTFIFALAPLVNRLRTPARAPPVRFGRPVIADYPPLCPRETRRLMTHGVPHDMEPRTTGYGEHSRVLLGRRKSRT